MTHIIMYTNWGVFDLIKRLHFFDLTHLREARAEILQKILVAFVGNGVSRKIAVEISRPLRVNDYL